MTASADEIGLQEFQERAVLRIKFSSLLGEGPRLTSDAGREHRGFFDNLPAGWSVTERARVEPAIFEHRHNASRLSSSEGDIVAIEYETGLELVLIAYALGEGTRLGIWAWKEWRQRRGKAREEGVARGQDAVSFETTTWEPTGAVTQRRVTFAGDQVDDEVIRKYMTGASAP
jgi:hypothetical protein